MHDIFKKPSKIKKSLKVIKTVFLTKFPMNLLFLLAIITLSVLASGYIIRTNTGKEPTGYVTLEQECKECICESEKEECECETDCELCPVKTKLETQEVIYYECPHGELVKETGECRSYLPNISGEYSGTVEGVTLAINDIEYEKDKEDSGFITRIDYTIINRGELPIVPRIEVKVYQEWTLKVKKSEANRVIDPEVVVNPNDYIRRKDKVRIYFEGKEQKVRMLLEDTLPDPDKEVLAVTRDFEIS